MGMLAYTKSSNKKKSAFFCFTKKSYIYILNHVYYFLFIFLLVFKYCLTIKKHIIMKKLFEKFYDYLSNLLYGGESMSHY
jgi:hypothetical protein